MKTLDVDQLRRDLGLTWMRLAAAAGVGLSTVYRWRRGSARPSPLALEKLRRLAQLKGKEAPADQPF